MDAAENQFLDRLAVYITVKFGRMRGLQKRNSLEIHVGFFGTKTDEFPVCKPPGMMYA